MAVDGRVAQDAVEPRNQRLVRDRREPVGGPDERVLQHVFGEVAPAEPPLEEAQEGAMVLDEDLDGSAAFVDARRFVIGGRAHLRSIGTAAQGAGILGV